MKILVISGFLGAGKTTFISTLSKKCKKEFVVMENEYGDVGIDGSILEEERLKVWELTEGCICCSLKSDFASSILTIANTLSPQYLIVEPTGVGLLSAVMRNISKIEYENIQLLGAITIVDVHSVKDYIDKFGDIYIDQIKNANLILLSKIEDVSSQEILDVASVLKTINPEAQILDKAYQKQKSEWWEGLFEKLHKKISIANTTPVKTTKDVLDSEHIQSIENVCFNDINFDSLNELLEFLVAVLREFFGIIYRAKGYVLIDNAWTKFDVVDKRYTVSLCQNFQEAKAVFIGEKLEKEKLGLALHSYND
ncbi:MAG: CobW family GTP-binding protein [Treponema sp.]